MVYGNFTQRPDLDLKAGYMTLVAEAEMGNLEDRNILMLLFYFLLLMWRLIISLPR